MNISMVNPRRVLVRGDRAKARECWVIGVSVNTVQVTDIKGFNMLRHGLNPDRIACVYAEDVFEVADNVRDGDSPDWSALAQFQLH